YRAVKRDAQGELLPLRGIAAGYRLPEGVRFLNIYQPRQGEQSRGEVTTTFLPGGWLEETIIYLQDADERKMNLRLAPLTGLTEIFEGYRDFR
ncbi:MAG: hypothetical protein L3J63_08390, partial [Geopsychrobacter sp.]|nr:hypothetical protein [Geopsychrobacter sp.]